MDNVTTYGQTNVSSAYNISAEEGRFSINGKNIGRNNPTYIIAEISGNHQLKYDRAEELVRAAAKAGADAIKLQTYTPDTMTINSQSPYFMVTDEGSLWKGNNLYQLYEKAYTPWEWVPKLKKTADQLGITFFSTAFDPTAVTYLERAINPPAHKVASFELIDLPLIAAAAKTGKPLFLSTGMATLGEIEEAIAVARRAGAKEIALFKCTSAYPAGVEDMNLLTIAHLRSTWNLPVGLSDHSIEPEVPLVAVALGASCIEKHIALSKDSGAVDEKFSLIPEEFRHMVDSIRLLERTLSANPDMNSNLQQGHPFPPELIQRIGRKSIIKKALGTIRYGVGEHEGQLRELRWRRSLFIVTGMKAGESFTSANVRSIRPADGLQPKYLNQILGKKARSDISPGTPLEWRLVE